MPRTFHEYHQEWDRLYREGQSMWTIARQYGTSGRVVQGALRKMGTPIRPSYQHRRAEFVVLAPEWVELYRSGVSAKEIARRYNVRYAHTVVLHLQRMGVQIRSNSEACRRYDIQNEGAFETLDNEEVAYWFGFLLADGAVYTKANNKGKQVNTYRVSLGLSHIDVDHIHRFARFLGTERPLQEVTRQRKSDDQPFTKLFYLNVASERLVSDLCRHGCVPRKTFVMSWPQALPDDMVRHFVRGYFDGDGTIAPRKHRDSAVVSWVSGSPEFLRHLRGEIERLLNVETGDVRHDRGKAYTLSYTKAESIFLLYDWLYHGANTYLERKKRKFEQFLFGGDPH